MSHGFGVSQCYCLFENWKVSRYILRIFSSLLFFFMFLFFGCFFFFSFVSLTYLFDLNNTHWPILVEYYSGSMSFWTTANLMWMAYANKSIPEFALRNITIFTFACFGIFYLLFSFTTNQSVSADSFTGSWVVGNVCDWRRLSIGRYSADITGTLTIFSLNSNLSLFN